MKNNTFFSLVIATLLVRPLVAAEECAATCGGHAAAAAPKTADELFTVKCECNVLHYTCDECRYELGLVKMDPSLVRSAENPKGLFKIEPVEKRVAQSLLALNGEIALNESALTHVSPRVRGSIRTIRAALG